MKLDTLLAHVGRPITGPVNPPVMRASTILFDDVESYDEMQKDRFSGLRYGAYGTESAFQLERALTEISGCHRAIVVPTGLAAITAAISAILAPGGHLLVADCVYGPTRSFCDKVLTSAGISVEYFNPLIGSEIRRLIKSNTQAVFCESPGSFTFEVVDIPALSEVTRSCGIPLVLDNTWATPIYFDALSHGVDISVEAVTKYINGHSDLVMGSISTTERWWRPIRERVADLGFATSPDDCYLALRGLRTLNLRLRHQQQSALKVAEWLSAHSKIEKVLYPPLPQDPGHTIWKRDFSGASSLFGVKFKAADEKITSRFIDSLELFGLGASWGGFESLVLPARYVRTADETKAIASVRLHIGIEDADDLIDDLEHALKTMSS